MARWIIGKGGTIVNVVGGDDKPVEPGFDVLLDTTDRANVGDTYDPKDVKLDDADQTIFTLLFRLHNRVRVLEGQPQHTPAQFRAAVKAMF